MSVDGPETEISVKCYRPRVGSPCGVYLLSQGLHFEGPDDPRLDRFCRVLAQAGFEVIAPRLPSFLDLNLRGRVTEEFESVFVQLDRITSLTSRPALFSVSFGSLPALRVAAKPGVRDKISAVITFGAYADWTAAIRFALGFQSKNRHERRHGGPDPLNQPVIFMNLVEELGLTERQQQSLRRAWFAYVRSTWGRDVCRQRSVREALARKIVVTLDSSLHDLYLLGCGLGDQHEALMLCAAAVARSPSLSSMLDVTPHVPQISAPVHLFHGTDDDVFPHEQLFLLKDAFPSHADVHAYLTGLYGHTGPGLTAMREVVGEMHTMLRMLHVLSSAPERPRF